MAITQLRPQHTTGRRYGSFAGRPSGAPTTHPVGRITQLRPQHVTGRRYGSFAGKPESTPDVPAVVAEALRNFSLREWRRWHRPEDEKELSRLGITPAAAEVIADVAAQQALDLRLGESQRLDALRDQMLLRGLRMQTRHIEALNREREGLIDEELRTRLNLLQSNNDIMALLVIAAVH